MSRGQGMFSLQNSLRSWELNYIGTKTIAKTQNPTRLQSASKCSGKHLDRSFYRAKRSALGDNSTTVIPAEQPFYLLIHPTSPFSSAVKLRLSTRTNHILILSSVHEVLTSLKKALLNFTKPSLTFVWCVLSLYFQVCFQKGKLLTG